MGPKSLKSLRLNRKSAARPPGDPNFWPLFDSQLPSDASGEKFVDPEEFPNFPGSNQNTLTAIDPQSSFKFDTEVISSFPQKFEQLLVQHEFFQKALGACEVLWNCETEPWSPFSNILTASGEPSYNPQGRYLVKLFHSEFWRQISVDDQNAVSGDDLGWPTVLLKGLWKISFPKKLRENLSQSSFEEKCECVLGLERKVSPFFGETTDVIQALTGWHGVRRSLREIQDKYSKWDELAAVVALKAESELVVLEMTLGGVLKYFEVADIRSYPQIQLPSLESWKSIRWKDWAIQNGTYRCESDINGIQIVLSPSRLPEIEDLVDNESYVGEKATPSVTSVTKSSSVLSVKSSRKSSLRSRKQEVSKAWLSFEKVRDLLESITIYKKPNFINKLVVSCESMEPQENLVTLPPNSEFFLMTEAEAEEKLVVSLSCMKTAGSHGDSVFHAHEFDWRGFSSTPLFLLRTGQSCSRISDLPKARKVFRATVNEAHFSVCLQSNADLKIFKDPLDLLKAMQLPPTSVLKYVDRLSDAFLDAPKSLEALQQLYKVILEPFVPELLSLKTTRDFLIHQFIDVLLENANDKFLLQSLFLRPKTSCSTCCYEYYKPVATEMTTVYNSLKARKCPCERMCELFDAAYVEQVRDFAALTIQKNFKRLQVQRILKKRKESGFEAEIEAFHEQTFKDPARILGILQQFLGGLKEYSVFYEDWKTQTDTKFFSGTLEAEGVHLLFSYPVWVYSRTPIPCLFTLKVDCNFVSLNLIDESLQTVQALDPGRAVFLRESESGFTVFAYVILPQKQEVHWELAVSTDCFHEGKVVVDPKDLSVFQWTKSCRKHFDQKVCRFFFRDFPLEDQIFLVFESSTPLSLSLKAFSSHKSLSQELQSENGRVFCLPLRWTQTLPSYLGVFKNISEEMESSSSLGSFCGTGTQVTVLQISLRDPKKAPESFEWVAKIFCRGDQAVEFDDLRELEDLELRRQWQEQGFLEDGTALRLAYPKPTVE